ncbi:MAG: hypothetical protein K2M65_04555, partial [Muribaculaceae bacterium]|nr:hypothetical protein [Muribaculaceae bacterium]
YIALGGDLDLNSITSQSFVPLGDAATPFNGTFDGKGFTIKNLTVAGFSYENMGIFGCLGTNATVKNINIENVRFGCTGYYAGIVAGTSEGVIDNVHVTSSTVVAAGEMGSGIVAMLNGGKVTNCSFQGAIQGPGSIAGIVSQAGNGVVDNCHTRANLTQNGYFSSACRDAGGVVGAAVKTAVTNCSSTGMFVDQKGYAAIGGVVARLLDGCTLENSFSTAIISATGNATIGSTSGSQILCYQGGLTGYAHATETYATVTAHQPLFSLPRLLPSMPVV